MVIYDEEDDGVSIDITDAWGLAEKHIIWQERMIIVVTFLELLVIWK